MIDTRLIDRLEVLAKSERKIKEFKRRINIKGKVSSKGETKKGNIRLKVEKDGDVYNFTILKSHKERYALAKEIAAGKSISISGIPKFRAIICTRLKVLGKRTADGKQETLDSF